MQVEMLGNDVFRVIALTKEYIVLLNTYRNQCETYVVST